MGDFVCQQLILTGWKKWSTSTHALGLSGVWCVPQTPLILWYTPLVDKWVGVGEGSFWRIVSSLSPWRAVLGPSTGNQAGTYLLSWPMRWRSVMGPSLNRTTTLSVSNGPPLSTYSHWRECLNTIEHAVFSCSGYLNISSFSIRTW